MGMTRRLALQTLAGGGLAAVAGLGTYGVAWERHRLQVTRSALPVRGLPPALEGLRIGLVSDLHLSAWVSRSEVAAAADRVTAERPDLILLAGDYVTWSSRDEVPPCAEALRSLSAPHGVFAVTGNHDPEATVTAAFGARGIPVLWDEHANLRVRGEEVALGGVRYWTRKPEELDQVFRGSHGFPVLLAHDPRRLAQAADLGIPLVLSGHTHGGQIVIPFVGAPAAARFPVAAGLARARHTTLFVTRGVGTVIVPIRLGCPPEVAILTLARS
jgi:hypothetical protein